MKNSIFFQETQRFNQWWVWGILVASCTAFWVNAAWPIFTRGAEWQLSDFWLPLSVQLLVITLFWIMRLETRITEDGVQVRFFPFHIKFKHYEWASIKEKTVRTYQPIAEYGGWGIRGLGKNRALNVSGTEGLQLVFVNGKRLLLGTRKPDEIKEILAKL